MGAKNVQSKRSAQAGVIVYRGIILAGKKIVWRAPEYRYTRIFAEQDARNHLATALAFSFDHTPWYQEERFFEGAPSA